MKTQMLTHLKGMFTKVAIAGALAGVMFMAAPQKADAQVVVRFGGPRAFYGPRVVVAPPIFYGPGYGYYPRDRWAFDHRFDHRFDRRWR